MKTGYLKLKALEAIFLQNLVALIDINYEFTPKET